MAFVGMGFGAAASGYRANAVTFDGTNDYLTATSATLSNSNQLTFSFWFRLNALTQDWFFEFEDSDYVGIKNRLLCRFDGATGPVQILGYNSSGTEILNIETSAIADTNWHHIMCSVDLSNASNRHLYLDNSSDLTVTTYSNDTINGADADETYIGTSEGLSGTILNGDMADLWLDTGTYIDLSSAANRKKFILNSNPVYLGADGALPTGTSPEIFLSGATASWHTNKGTGGGFTENGALTDASTSPSD